MIIPRTFSPAPALWPSNPSHVAKNLTDDLIAGPALLQLDDNPVAVLASRVSTSEGGRLTMTSVFAQDRCCRGTFSCVASNISAASPRPVVRSIQDVGPHLRCRHNASSAAEPGTPRCASCSTRTTTSRTGGGDLNLLQTRGLKRRQKISPYCGRRRRTCPTVRTSQSNSEWMKK